MNTELLAAAEKGDAAAMRRLLEQGADANAADERGRSILFFAAGSRNGTAATRLLLTHHVDVNAVTRKYGFTPLINAIRSAQWEAARLLLENGADADAAAGDALIGVITGEFDEDEKANMVHLLLKRGVRHSPVDFKGRTALWWAEWFDLSKVIELLVAAGATS